MVRGQTSSDRKAHPDHMLKLMKPSDYPEAKRIFSNVQMHGHTKSDRWTYS